MSKIKLNEMKKYETLPDPQSHSAKKVVVDVKNWSFAIGECESDRIYFVVCLYVYKECLVK